MNSLDRLRLLSLLLCTLIACTNTIPGNPPTVMPTTQSTRTCSVSPSQSKLRPDMAALAGEFPLWLTVGTGTYSWSKQPISLPPYPGRMDKIIWTVDTRVSGDLRITGKQLGGDGVLLFADKAKTQIDDKGQVLGSIIEDKPSDVRLILSAENGVQNSPPGFQDHGGLVYYPHPGCYQYTATIADHTVQIVVEVLDQ